MSKIALVASAFAASLLLSAGAARAGGCAQKWNDTGFDCLHLHDQKACEARQAKVHGKLQHICAWTVARPVDKNAHHKPGCDFCGDPKGGFLTSKDQKNGKFFSVFKATKPVDAAGACPAGWIRFGQNHTAYGATEQQAEAAAKSSDVCK
jgi:hypothetical protein